VKIDVVHFMPADVTVLVKKDRNIERVTGGESHWITGNSITERTPFFFCRNPIKPGVNAVIMSFPVAENGAPIASHLEMETKLGSPPIVFARRWDAAWRLCNRRRQKLNSYDEKTYRYNAKLSGTYIHNMVPMPTYSRRPRRHLASELGKWRSRKSHSRICGVHFHTRRVRQFFDGHLSFLRVSAHLAFQRPTPHDLAVINPGCR
jgi:hypothetical protein